MISEEKILKAIEALADTITRKDNEIGGLNWKIGNQKEQINALQEQINNESNSAEQYESTIRAQNEYIESLEAKIYELEERIAIMTEEGPLPICEIKPTKKERYGE